MTIRKAIIDGSGNVLNTVALPDDWQPDNVHYWQPEAGLTLVPQDDGAEPGGTYADDAFAPRQPPAVPEPTQEQQDIADLKATIQTLVDKNVISRDDLPTSLQAPISVDQVVSR